ncbi:MAG: hypothetical protein U1C46_01960 [Bacteroidales bacterium]|nr:hypothetical protein [Bacteroidales bacterium]MDZ4203560.1 hypothetical protein [Bacteroidales bacterium]
MYFAIEILRYLLPLLFLLGVVYLMVIKFLSNEREKRSHALKLAKNNILLPIRMQAYERIILFLERIVINHLILRINQAGMTSGQLHAELISSIREEFNHNLSQQVYISAQGWEFVRAAREETIRLINTTGGTINREEPSLGLAGRLLEEAAAQENDPVARALDFLKAEAGQLF